MRHFIASMGLIWMMAGSTWGQGPGAFSETKLNWQEMAGGVQVSLALDAAKNAAAGAGEVQPLAVNVTLLNAGDGLVSLTESGKFKGVVFYTLNAEGKRVQVSPPVNVVFTIIQAQIPAGTSQVLNVKLTPEMVKLAKGGLIAGVQFQDEPGGTIKTVYSNKITLPGGGS